MRFENGDRLIDLKDVEGGGDWIAPGFDGIVSLFVRYARGLGGGWYASFEFDFGGELPVCVSAITFEYERH